MEERVPVTWGEGSEGSVNRGEEAASGRRGVGLCLCQLRALATDLTPSDSVSLSVERQ